MSVSDGRYGMIAAYLIFFACAHLFKAARFYLVLLEQDIPLKRYLFLYARTTLVNLVIPYKLGEIYRVAAVYHVTDRHDKTPHGATAFLSVCVDRFFDTLALLAIIIPFGLIYKGSIDYVPLFLLLVLLIFVFLYLSIPQSYRYLNEYIIMYRRTKRSVGILRWLEAVRTGQKFAQSLIKGRAPLIILASFLGWGAEFMALRSFYKLLGESFSMESFSLYINSLLSGNAGSLAKLYNLLGIIIFAVITAVFLIVWLRDAHLKKAASGKFKAADIAIFKDKEGENAANPDGI